MAPTTKKNNTSIETETFGRRNGALKTCGIQVDTNDKRAPRVGETAAQSPRRLRRHRKPADDPITADPTVNQPSQVQRSGTSRIPSTSRRDESNYSAMTKRRRRLDLNATRNKYGQHQLELRQPVKKPHVLHVISEVRILVFNLIQRFVHTHWPHWEILALKFKVWTQHTNIINHI